MPTMDRACQRCGKKHLADFVWLELNTWTGLYHTPGTLPANGLSQGLFPFGQQCARQELRRTAATVERVA
jgi:hypothetical protein